jgi:hypothetical protein
MTAEGDLVTAPVPAPDNPPGRPIHYEALARSEIMIGDCGDILN